MFENEGFLMDLTQSEADGLRIVRKLFLDKMPLIINQPYSEQRQLRSETNPYDTFYLNINQTAIEFGKYNTLTRYFSICLVRICIDKDSVHENPDGKKIKGHHIHIYKEGYADRFAYPLENYNFSNFDIVPLLRQFLRFCNIEDITISEQRSMADGI
jgi:hypothetical protein